MWTQAVYPFNLASVDVAKIILYGPVHLGFREVRVRCGEIDQVTYFDRERGFSGGQRLGKVRI
jgi:hypothetical protein